MTSTATAENDDDVLAEQFLDDLRTELENAGDYGTRPWRVTRDAQIARLYAFGWEIADLATHYRASRPVIRNALRRQRRRDTSVDVHTPRRWTLRLPEHGITVDGTRTDIHALHALLTTRGETCSAPEARSTT